MIAQVGSKPMRILPTQVKDFDFLGITERFLEGSCYMMKVPASLWVFCRRGTVMQWGNQVQVTVLVLAIGDVGWIRAKPWDETWCNSRIIYIQSSTRADKIFLLY